MSDASVDTRVPVPPLRAAQVGAALALATALSALFYYKWGASLRAYAGVQSSGHLSVNPDVLMHGGAWATTLVYFAKIWPALVYGIVVGSVIRAAIPPSWIARALGGRGVKGALVGGIAGAPLMLCSCCVTPIFTGLYERGARLSSSLAVMLGSPGLNVAALVLTFALLPPKLAILRAVTAMVIVVGLPLLLGRFEVPARAKGSCAVEPNEPMSARDFALRFVRSLVYLVLVTVPLIAIGALLGGLALPYVTHLHETGVVVGVLGVALVSVLVALPTFFEIPIALLLLQMGAPAGAALVVLVAGPIVNLPSLFVLGRETSPRFAVALAAGIWGIASVAGIAASMMGT